MGSPPMRFARNSTLADKLTRRLKAGMIGINNPEILSPETPLGGVKASGYGHEGAAEGLKDYLDLKVTAAGL